MGTSPDGVIWDQDAEYAYYLHGPLARVEIGDQAVQGIDYAYTIHGWIKGVNSDILKEDYDIGRDGYAGPSSTNDYIPGQAGVHELVARDAFSFSLGYYDGDYTPIHPGTRNPFLATTASTTFGTTTPDLYNACPANKDGATLPEWPPI